LKSCQEKEESGSPELSAAALGFCSTPNLREKLHRSTREVSTTGQQRDAKQNLTVSFLPPLARTSQKKQNVTIWARFRRNFPKEENGTKTKNRHTNICLLTYHGQSLQPGFWFERLSASGSRQLQIQRRFKSIYANVGTAVKERYFLVWNQIKPKYRCLTPCSQNTNWANQYKDDILGAKHLFVLAEPDCCLLRWHRFTSTTSTRNSPTLIDNPNSFIQFIYLVFALWLFLRSPTLGFVFAVTYRVYHIQQHPLHKNKLFLIPYLSDESFSSKAN